MPTDFVIEVAAVVAVAALLGALLGAWIAKRCSTGDPQIPNGFQALTALIEQSAKTTRETVESARGAVTNAERAFGATLGEGLGSVSSSLTVMRTEISAAFEAASTRAKLEAAEINKALSTEIAASLQKQSTDQGSKIDAFGKKTEERLDAFSTKLETSGATIAKSITEFQKSVTEGMGEVRTTVTQFGGNMTTTLAENQTRTAKALTDEFAKLTTHVDTKITEMRTGNEEKLLAIQGVVDQKLQEGIEKRMTESFAKITTQFAEVQQAVGEVKVVAGQVGDLKRLFSNVRSRGGWSEAQVKAILDDILPPNSYEMNKCVNPATSDTVEFALKLPMLGDTPVYLAVDAKFPIEDYSRLLDAVEIADLIAEKAARTGLESRIRQEARKIQSKYIAPPHTVEWAILYLPSEGLYSEVARSGDLIETIQRENRIMIMGPSMLAVMLRTIQLGHYTLAISQKADMIGQILGAVKHEMVDFGNQFRLLEKNVQTLGNNIRKGRTRANVISRKLRDVAALEGPAASSLLELASETEAFNPDDADSEDVELVEPNEDELRVS